MSLSVLLLPVRCQAVSLWRPTVDNMTGGSSLKSDSTSPTIEYPGRSEGSTSLSIGALTNCYSMDRVIIGLVREGASTKLIPFHFHS